MERNIEKMIADYYALADREHERRRYKINYSDIMKIYEISTSPAEQVINALAAGFMIGYRAAELDGRSIRIADTLKQLRGDAPPEQIAEAVGVSVASYKAYEDGERLPRNEVTKRLADYFGVRLSLLK